MTRPLKKELQAVVTALLEPADTPEESAVRAISALDASRVGKVQYVVGTRVAGVVALIGPYPTVHQAALGAAALAKGPVDVSEGHGVYGIIPAASITDPSGRIDCPDCAHPWAAHGWPKLAGSGCVVALNPRSYVEGARRAGTLEQCGCSRSRR